MEITLEWMVEGGYSFYIIHKWGGYHIEIWHFLPLKDTPWHYSVLYWKLKWMSACVLLFRLEEHDTLSLPRVPLYESPNLHICKKWVKCVNKLQIERMWHIVMKIIWKCKIFFVSLRVVRAGRVWALMHCQLWFVHVCRCAIVWQYVMCTIYYTIYSGKWRVFFCVYIISWNCTKNLLYKRYYVK